MMIESLLTIVCLLHCASAGTTVFLDATNGNDMNDGLSAGTAWQNIERLDTEWSNDMVVNLKRGEVFRGQFGRNKQGMSYRSGIRFQAYGAAGTAKPVIAGSFVIAGPWTNEGSNVWTAAYTLPNGGMSRECGNDDPQAGQTITHLYVDGQLQRMARFPNEGTLRSTTAGSTGMNNFVSTELTQTTNYWNGANVRIRTWSWHWQTGVVQSYDSTTNRVTLTNNLQNDGTNPLAPGWGFYFDNLESELDSPGEWFLDTANSRVKLYSTSDPSGSLVEAQYSGWQTSICIFYNHGTVVEDIAMRHQGEQGVMIWLSDNVEIRRVDQMQGSNHGLEVLWNSLNFLVEDSTFRQNLNHGMKFNSHGTFNVGTSTVRGCLVENSGMIRGYGRPAYASGSYNFGVRLGGGASPVNFTENIVRLSGRGGISCDGEIIVSRTQVDRACSTHNDCSGIVQNRDGLVMDQNFIYDTVGDMTGSGSSNVGVPINRFSWGLRSHLGNDAMQFTRNYVYSNQAEGILVEETDSHTVSDNVFYQNGNVARGSRQADFQGSTGLTTTGNVWFADDAGIAGGFLTASNPVASDNNVFCNPQLTDAVNGMTLAAWQTSSSLDANSRGCDGTITDHRLLTNPSDAAVLHSPALPGSDADWIWMRTAGAPPCRPTTTPLIPPWTAMLVVRSSAAGTFPLCSGGTNAPTTAAATGVPSSAAPSPAPTASPSSSKVPTGEPSQSPSQSPTKSPATTTGVPSLTPTGVPTNSPTTAATPSAAPSQGPTAGVGSPTAAPTTKVPSVSPSSAPSMAPSSKAPSQAPSKSPTGAAGTPTASPTTKSPTKSPTSSPARPTGAPSNAPTLVPSASPTVTPGNPTKAPTSKAPTSQAPSKSPTGSPTVARTFSPTFAPTTSAPTQGNLGPIIGGIVGGVVVVAGAIVTGVLCYRHKSLNTQMSTVQNNGWGGL